MNHEHKNARQYSDTMECSTCGKQWDVNDPEPPPCLDVRAFVVVEPVYRSKPKRKLRKYPVLMKR